MCAFTSLRETYNDRLSTQSDPEESTITQSYPLLTQSDLLTPTVHTKPECLKFTVGKLHTVKFRKPKVL